MEMGERLVVILLMMNKTNNREEAQMHISDANNPVLVLEGIRAVKRASWAGLGYNQTRPE